MFWILDEVRRTGDAIATITSTGIEANFIGISTNNPSQTFVDVWKSKLKIVTLFLCILKNCVY
jgi:hypothetical protein